MRRRTSFGRLGASPYSSTSQPPFQFQERRRHDAPGRTMSEASWDKLNSSPYVSPGILSHGLPPPADSTDSYEHKWKKLILLELHDSLAEFRKAQRRLQEPLELRAPLRIEMYPMDGDKCGVRVRALDDDLLTIMGIGSAADLINCILKLPNNDGWVYVTGLDKDDLEELRRAGSPPFRVPLCVDGLAIVYDDGFKTRNIDTTLEYNCTVFESFTGFMYRFQALSRFMEIDPGVRGAVDNTSSRRLVDLHRNLDSSGLLPAAGEIKMLNKSQADILRRVSGPVDFVQGPPGTGKSTFIVEFLSLRVPPDARVLLCTTTNKAIDSLAEKLASRGFSDDLLAFGNEARLGATSTQHLLKHRASKHAATRAFEVLLSTLNSIQKDAGRRQEELEELQTNNITTRNPANRITAQFFRKPEPDVGSQLDKRKQSVMRRTLKAVNSAFQSALTGSLLETPQSVRDIFSQLCSRAGRLFMTCVREPITHGHIESSTIKDSVEFRVLLTALESLLTVMAAFNTQVQAAVKRHILDTARFVVCTAATVVRLPHRIALEFSGIEQSDGSTGLDVVAIARKLASQHLTSKGGTSDAEPLDGQSFTFPYVVLDEAGAMLEPDVIGTIIHGCKFLLCVGDHLQLRPFTTWRDGERLSYNVSLLERLAKNRSGQHNRMTIQYRMHPSIAAIVSDTFYQGSLTTAPEIKAARSRIDPVVFIHINGCEQRVGTSYKNEFEAEAVVRLVQRERAAHPRSVINVIAFHTPQVKALRAELKQQGLLRDDVVDVITVDSMQGREADIIVLSCARTGPTIGFLTNEQRLNVAISRAKEKMYIVGHREALGGWNAGKWPTILSHSHMKKGVLM